MAIEINTLGRLQIMVDGQDVTAQLDASRIFLLIYLADTGQPQPRAYLAELLWAERPAGQARSNLRTLLSRLRPRLGDYLQAAPAWLALPPASTHLDLHAFAEQLALAQCGDPAVVQQALATAMTYYQDDFLATYTADWNSEIEAWVTARRLALHGQAVQALRQLLAAPHWHTAPALLTYSRQLLHLEPLDESACAQLMGLLAQHGQRDEALWHYQRYQAALSDVWATATPSEALVMLAAKIRLGLPLSGYASDNGLTADAAHQPQPVAGQHQASQAAKTQVTVARDAQIDLAPSPELATAFHFPAPLKPLMGRRQEQEQLVQWLDLGYRLISVTGLGGVGKSHFVQTVIAAQQTRWRHGALYVALAPPTERVIQPHLTPQAQQQAAVETLGRALTAPFAIALQPHQDYASQLQAALSGYAGCLVLDQFDHALPAAAYIQSVLARAGNLTVIVIARRRLGLAAEVNLTLTGLPLAPPLSSAGCEQPTDGTALALLLHNLARHLPGFHATAADLAALQRICQAVHGLPLALELAPVLARRLPLPEVAARLTAAPLTLAADFADLPEQQRSLYTVMDAMFTDATTAVQTALVSLAVFAGPFTTADVSCVVSDQLLDELNQQSWLETVSVDQFTLHPLVASFVRSLCVDQQWAAIYAHARRLHAVHYVKLVADQPFFQNSYYTERIAWLRQYFAEITAACQTLLDDNAPAAVDLLHVITMYGHHFGDLHAVHQWLQRGLTALPPTAPARLRLLLDYVTCATELRDLAAAEAALAEAHTLAANQPDQEAMLALYERLGWTAHFDYATTTPQRRRAGRQYFSQALALAEATGNQAQVVNQLAQRAFLACWEAADMPQARTDLQRAVELAYQLGQQGLLGSVYKMFAYLEFVAGRLPLAQRYSERALQLLTAEAGAAMTCGWLYAERSQMALTQRDVTAARHYLTLARAIFTPAGYAAGLTQCDTVEGIVALLAEDLVGAERCWLRAYQAVYKMHQQEKLSITIMLGIGVTQLVNGDPILGAQLVTVAAAQYKERIFHWVQPEQELMRELLERACHEMTLLALPAMPVDAQVVGQALLLLAEHTLR